MICTHLMWSNQGYLSATGEQVELPFHLFDGKIILPIKVDDQVVLNFALDTGVNQPILLDYKWAKRLGWQYDRTTQFLGVGSKRKLSAKVTNPQVKLSLPGMEGTNITFLVLGQDPLNLRAYDIHGLIGAHLFMDALVKIDFKRRRITFMKRSLFEDYRGQYHPVDLKFKNLKPLVMAEIHQQSKELLLDLGSAHEVLLYQTSGKKNQVAFLGQGLGGTFEAYGHQTQQLSMGGLVWSPVKIITMKAKRYSRASALAHRAGTLGSGFFKDCLLVLDYKHQKMYLKPNNSAEMNNIQQEGISVQNHQIPIIQ